MINYYEFCCNGACHGRLRRDRNHRKYCPGTGLKGRGSKMRKRDARFEFIRIVSMILVVGVHSFATVSPTYAEGSLTGRMISTFLLLSNGLFFMISGKFALSTCFRTGEDYKKYYLKRIGSIGIPVLVGMLLRSVYNVGGWWPEYYVSPEFLREYLGNVLAGFASCEYWFLYRLVGFLAAAPFLGRMLQHSGKTDLLWLVGICMFWNTLETCLPAMGYAFAWSFPLSGSLVVFVLGYALDRIVETEKEEKILLGLGCASFAVSMVLLHFGFSEGVNSTLPTYSVMVCAMFTALKKLYRPGKRLDAVVLKTGGLTMPVYLLHMIVLYSVLPYIPRWPFFFRAVALQLVTVLLTLILGYILDRTVLSGLQWLYRKLVRLQ